MINDEYERNKIFKELFNKEMEEEELRIKEYEERIRIEMEIEEKRRNEFDNNMKNIMETEEKRRIDFENDKRSIMEIEDNIIKNYYEQIKEIEDNSRLTSCTAMSFQMKPVFQEEHKPNNEIPRIIPVKIDNKLVKNKKYFLSIFNAY